VGRRAIAWRDESRPDPLAPDPAARRELVAWVWYPAAATPGAARATYLPAAWLRELRPGRGEQRLDRVHGHALDAPPLSDAEPRYPVLVFAPGLGMMPTHYTALAEELASHGYVVVAVAHPYSTWAVVYPDGRVARATESRVPFGWTRMVPVLAGDLVSALDYVVRQHDAGDAFFARIDPARVGVLGHSFGGAAAALACRMDPRFRAGMDLDGSVFGEAIRKGVPRPFLLMMADIRWDERFDRDPPRFFTDRDQGYLHERMLFDRSPTAYYVSVRGLAHINFADQGFFFDPQERFLEAFGARLDATRTQELGSTYIRAFFGRYLRGEESPGGELEYAPFNYTRLRYHRAPSPAPARAGSVPS
jgi:predicted dienelactone hydrolase